jgi:hypothetical protein
MSATSIVSANNSARSKKKRGIGRRLILWLMILFVLILFFIRYEELVEPLHRSDYTAQVTKKSDLRDNEKVKDDYYDELWKKKIDTLIDDDKILDSSTNKDSGNKIFSLKILPHLERWKSDANEYRKRKPTKNQNTNDQEGLRRQQGGAAEVFQAFPIIQDTDDNIPMAAGGSVIHAADALLCRDFVLDYVINATDLKDECDGLKKAYTQTCARDEENYKETEPSQPERLLVEQTDTVVDWQQSLFYWIRHFPILFTSSSMTTYRLLKEDDTKVPIGTADKLQVMDPKNSTKILGNKKPLANLALPVMSKHVSEKLLTETLMLQQDNKLMKAVVNQTNHTITEAQADAALSSKAVAEAADMVSNVLNDPTSVEARTCCTSILSVFHENCNVNEEEELSDRRLFVGVAVIALCGLVKSLIRHFHIRWLPEAAGCIMVGGKISLLLSIVYLYTRKCSV